MSLEIMVRLLELRYSSTSVVMNDCKSKSRSNYVVCYNISPHSHDRAYVASLPLLILLLLKKNMFKPSFPTILSPSLVCSNRPPMLSPCHRSVLCSDKKASRNDPRNVFGVF
jgi:hypothetical protein